MSEIMTEGLTMEGTSPDPGLSAGEKTEAAFENTEAETGIPLTKRISERINSIRQESGAMVSALKDEYEAELKKRDEMFARYRTEQEGARKNDPELVRLREMEFKRQKEDVLSQLKNEYPDDNIVDIEHFPREFYAMLSLGVEPGLAYMAAVVRRKKPSPPTAGSIRTDALEEPNFFSREQVAGMSREQIMKHYDAIMASQKKW